MIDEQVRDHVYRSIHAFKLVTGELLVGMLMVKNQHEISVFIPYIFEGNTLKDYCTQFKDSKIDLSVFHLMFYKKPSDQIVDSYIKRVISEKQTEFRQFIVAYAAIVAQNMATEPTDVSRVDGDASVLH
jgi:hypothetical protein